MSDRMTALQERWAQRARAVIAKGISTDNNARQLPAEKEGTVVAPSTGPKGKVGQ